MRVIGSDAYLDSPLLSPRERAAVLWAEHVARNTARERDDVLHEVRQHYIDAELVELTSACGAFASGNRFQDSMAIPLEAQAEVDKIKRSLRVDAKRLKAYIGQLVADWPDAFPDASAHGTEPVERAGTAAGESWNDSSRTPPAAQPAAAVPQTTPIPLLDPLSAQPEAALFMRSSEELLGALTNANRLWAHAPYIAKLWPPYQVVMEREGAGSRLPARIKVLALIRTAHLNSASYSLAHRTALGRAAGISDAQLDALAAKEGPNADVFSATECAVLRWTDHVASNTAKRRADLFDALKQHFDDARLVELTGVCAMANQVDLTLNALRVPLESAPEVEAANRSIRIDPARVKTYLETLYVNWPDEFP